MTRFWNWLKKPSPYPVMLQFISLTICVIGITQVPFRNNGLILLIFIGLNLAVIALSFSAFHKEWVNFFNGRGFNE